MTRAMTPLMIIIVLLALLIAMSLGLNGLFTGLVTPEKKTANCRLGPLSLEIGAGQREDTIVISYSIQPPNPCYHIESVKLVQVEKMDNSLHAVIEINATGPGPEKLCVQVLPPPIVGEIPLHVATAPHKLELAILLTLRLDNGATKNYSCNVGLEVRSP